MEDPVRVVDAYDLPARDEVVPIWMRANITPRKVAEMQLKIESLEKEVERLEILLRLEQATAKK